MIPNVDQLGGFFPMSFWWFCLCRVRPGAWSYLRTHVLQAWWQWVFAGPADLFGDLLLVVHRPLRRQEQASSPFYGLQCWGMELKVVGLSWKQHTGGGQSWVVLCVTERHPMKGDEKVDQATQLCSQRHLSNEWIVLVSYFNFLRCICWFEGQRGRSSICQFILQMLAVAPAGPDQSQKLGTQSKCPTWVLGTQILGQSVDASKGSLGGNWIKNKRLDSDLRCSS